MPNLPLTLACWDYDRTRPLFDGRVKPDGIDLDIKVMRPRQIFPRMLERQEFHVSELSFASFVGLKARGKCPFVALPVALSNLRWRHAPSAPPRIKIEPVAWPPGSASPAATLRTSSLGD